MTFGGRRPPEQNYFRQLFKPNQQILATIFLSFIFYLLSFINVSSVFAYTFSKDTGGTLNTGLVSYYPLNDSGTTITDAVGVNNGSAVGTTIDATGKLISSRTFNGSSDYVSIPYNASLNITGSFSISAWIKPTNSAGYGFIFGRGKDQSGEYRFRQYGTAIAFQMNSPGWTTHISSPGLNIGAWNHVVVVLSPATQNIKMYINNVQVLSESETRNLTANTLAAAIGKETVNYSEFFSGGIDEIGLWSKALSTTEITDLYNGGSGDPCVTIVSGTFSSAPSSVNVCTNTNVCSTGSQTNYSVSIPSYASSYTLTPQAISNYAITPANQAVNVACNPLAGSTYTYHALVCAPAGNIVGMWHMDELSGQNVADSSGNNITGTAQNNTVIGTAFSVDTSNSLKSNLVTYYRFDDVDSIIRDVQGVSNGSAVGTTIDTTGKLISSRTFNGSSDYVSIPYNASLNLTSSFSISTWIKPALANGSGFIFSRGKDAAGEYRFGQSGSSIFFQANYAGAGWRGHVSSAALNIGQWNHAAVVFNSSTQNIKLYINGTQVLSESEPNSLSANSLNAAIGREGGSAQSYFAGGIDELGFWSKALSTTEIADLYNGSNGDSLNPVYAQGTTIVAGKYGKARSFNGTGDFINLGDIGLLEATSNFSIEAWIKTSGSNPTSRMIFAKKNDSSAGYYMWINGSGKLEALFGAVQATSTRPVNDNQWHHVAATRNGNTITVYVDGVPDGSATGSISVADTTISARIGRSDHSASGYYFPGIIDEVRVFNRTLSGDEVYTEFNQLCCTSIKTNCSYGSCQGVCPNGTQTGTCYDSGCNQPISDTIACTPPNQITISGGISNISSPVSVCASKQGSGGGCTNNVCSIASTTSYNLSVNGTCTYKLTIDTVSGRTVEPQDYQMTTGCFDSTGPWFWYNSAAGVVSSGGTINSGSGNVSVWGASPGYRLSNYSYDAPTNKAGYTEFLRIILKNSGVSTSSQLESSPLCQPGQIYSSGNFDFYCYSTSQFDTVLNSAVTSGSTSKTLVLYPRSDSGVGTQTISSVKTSNGRRLVVFVNGGLQVNSNVTVTANDTSAMVFLTNQTVNPANPGDLLVSSAVTRLDGVYVFPGTFNDIVDNGDISQQLVGRGSILSLGSSPWNLGRAYSSASGPAELFTYEPKYLSIYKDILAVPKYSWKELAPE